MSTYRELLEQKSALDQQIAIARKAEAKQALDAVHTLIAEFGFQDGADFADGIGEEAFLCLKKP